MPPVQTRGGGGEATCDLGCSSATTKQGCKIGLTSHLTSYLAMVIGQCHGQEVPKIPCSVFKYCIVSVTSSLEHTRSGSFHLHSLMMRTLGHFPQVPGQLLHQLEDGGLAHLVPVRKSFNIKGEEGGGFHHKGLAQGG